MKAVMENSEHSIYFWESPLAGSLPPAGSAPEVMLGGQPEQWVHQLIS